MSTTKKTGRRRVENPKVAYKDRSAEQAPKILWACKICRGRPPHYLYYYRNRASNKVKEGQAFSTHLAKKHKGQANEIEGNSYKWGERRWEPDGDSADFRTITIEEEAENVGVRVEDLEAADNRGGSNMPADELAGIEEDDAMEEGVIEEDDDVEEEDEQDYVQGEASK